MTFDPAARIQDLLVFGEFGDVNPSITDSSTFTFLDPKRMEETFEHDIEGCFLYSRHWNPTNKYLADALARMEDGEAAQVMSSGMGAISTTILALCGQGDQVVCGRNIYGGTYALLKNLLPRFGITTRFVDMTEHAAVRAAMTPRTRVLYAESVSNPLLEVADIPALAQVAHAAGARLVVDNTFSPMMLSPLRLGADVVLHSMTKYINGTSDCVAGCVVSDRAFIDGMNDVNAGTSMLLGPVLDSFRAASIMKNLHGLHIRMQKHGANAAHLAHRLASLGFAVHYPGLERHPQHALLRSLMNPGYGYGGMLTLDVGGQANANRLMQRMQEEKVGYLAVSLGYFKTLFSSPAHSTSSELPPEDRARAGIPEGLIRFSIGLDASIEHTSARIERCLESCGLRPGALARG